MDVIGQNGNTGVHYSEVDKPSHYTAGAVECIVAIKAALSDDEWRGFVKGNCIKYVWRERGKEGDTSLAKARWYLNQLLDIETKTR